MDQQRPSRWVYAGVFTMTAATLILELTLTRIYSVIMFYHFAFLAISLALFGFGFAGIYVYVRPKLTSPEHSGKALAYYGIGAGITPMLSLMVILKQKIDLTLASKNFINLSIIYLASAVPFFFAGVCLTIVIKRHQQDMGRLYFYDLVGAGLGCLLLAPLLGLIGGLNCMLLTGVLFMLSSVFFQMASPTDPHGLRFGTRLATGFVGLFLLVNAFSPYLHIPSVKETIEGSVIYAKWNSFSRVTVERTSKNYYWLKMDSSAATRIFNAKVVKDQGPMLFKDNHIRLTGLVYALKKPGKSLIIGPGGGTDVLTALSLGQKDVTGVELNPIIVDLMKTTFAQFNGRIYHHPNVKAYAGEGRHFIRSGKNRYQSIQATMVDTWAATAAGAFSLSENTLYTREAFRDYFQALEPDGVLTMYRWKREPPHDFFRLLTLGRQALDELGGIKDPSQHFFAAFSGPSGTFLLKKTPFTPEEVKTLEDYCKEFKFNILHTPSKELRNPYAELLFSKDWKQNITKYAHDVRPPDDNRPFFFYTVRPEQLLKGGYSWKKLGEHDKGLVVLLGVLALVFVLVLLFFGLPLFAFRRDVLREERGAKLRYLFYFLMLGMGFISVEIALLQHFVLFLGHPTYALIVSLFSLLIFSGLGSYRSRGVTEERVGKQILMNMLILGGISVAYVVLLPIIFQGLIQLPQALRVVIAMALLAPLGLYMGTMLPLGIQGAGARFSEIVPWAWGINGAGSVLGSVLAIFLALNWGYRFTLLAGLLFYGLGIVACTGLFGSRTTPTSPAMTPEPAPAPTSA